jgi:hypothetical protein
MGLRTESAMLAPLKKAQGETNQRLEKIIDQLVRSIDARGRSLCC